MQQFISFIIKETQHILRDKRSLMILFIMPIVQLLMFGYALTNELKNADIAVLDKAANSKSQQLIRKLVSSSYFSLSLNLRSDEEILETLRSGKAKEVIVIPSDFGRNSGNMDNEEIQLILDSSDPNFANLIESYTRSIIMSYLQEEMGISVSPIETKIVMQFNRELKSAFMFVPGLMALILTLISAFMTSISITREKELGTMEILLVSPLNPIQIIFGKVFPYVILSFINSILILLVSVIFFHIPIAGNVLLLLAVCGIYIFLVLALGILVSTITSSQQVAMMFSLVGLLLPTILLSGFIFPIENLPKLLQIFSFAVPARWFVYIVKAIMIKGTNFIYLIDEIAILVGMAVFYMIISLKKFKIRLD